MEEERTISVYGNDSNYGGDDAPTVLLKPEDMPVFQKNANPTQTDYTQTQPQTEYQQVQQPEMSYQQEQQPQTNYQQMQQPEMNYQQQAQNIQIPQNTVNTSQSLDKPKSGKSVASFVLGLLAILCCPLSFILGVIGLIFGIASRKKKQGKKGLAVTGIVFSIIGIVSSILALIATVLVLVFGGWAGIKTAVKISNSIKSASGNSGSVDFILDVLSYVDVNNIDWSDPDSIEKEITKAAARAVFNQTLNPNNISNALDDLDIDTSQLGNVDMGDIDFGDVDFGDIDFGDIQWGDIDFGDDVDAETLEDILNGDISEEDIENFLKDNYNLTDGQIGAIEEMLEENK